MAVMKGADLAETLSEEEVDLREWKGFFSVNEMDNLMAEVDTAPAVLPCHHHACLLASGTLLQIHLAMQGVSKELTHVTSTYRPLTMEANKCSKPENDEEKPKKILKKQLNDIRNTIIGSIYILEDVAFILPPDGEEPIKVGNGEGKYVFVFQMLIGEENLECGFPAGMTYGIIGNPGIDESGNLKVNKLKGNSMMGAGYLLLSTNTTFVCSYEHKQGTHEYTWDKSLGEFLTTKPDLSIPEFGKVYSIDHSKTIGWDNATKTLLTNMINPRLGREGRHYYVDCPVAENHAVIREGGIYMSPKTAYHPQGKLLLVHECWPLAYVTREAGGFATDGRGSVLELAPQDIGCLSPYIGGSKAEVFLLMGINMSSVAHEMDESRLKQRSIDRLDPFPWTWQHYQPETFEDPVDINKG